MHVHLHMTFPSPGFQRSAPRAPFPPRVRQIMLGVIGLMVLGLIVVPWFGSFVTDWLWYNEIGYQTVFLKSLVARVLLFVARRRLRVRVPVWKCRVDASRSAGSP